MEELKRAVKEIAYARDYANFSTLQRSLLPFLFLSSSLYRVALSLRAYLYHLGIFTRHRLPVPVISVGNLTWGGNGKTPMVEFIAKCLAVQGPSPLILTRGYGGGDEPRMLERHFLETNVKVGVGPNRGATANWFLEKYGYLDSKESGSCMLSSIRQPGVGLRSEKIGTAILDDGMQHWRLYRDLEIVMVNGLVPWGNCRLSPLGPLREPLTSLTCADVAVIHHADLVTEAQLEEIKMMMRGIKESLPIFYSRMAPSHFFELSNVHSKISLQIVRDAIVLCMSAIGSADSFVQVIKTMGALYVGRLDFSDHHLFQSKDIQLMRLRLRQLKEWFKRNPIAIVTEKDYDRDPKILKHLEPYKVLVLCSELEIMNHGGCGEDCFKFLVKNHIDPFRNFQKPMAGCGVLTTRNINSVYPSGDQAFWFSRKDKSS